MKKRPVVLLTAALALAVALTPATTTAATSRVRAVAVNTWDPNYRHIAKGDRITWVNADSITHDVKSIGKKWRKYTVIAPGERTSRRFRKRGLYRYRCRTHSTMSNGSCRGMCGKVHVD